MKKLLVPVVLVLALLSGARAQSLEVTSAGVGIGTSAPGAALDVQVAANTLGARIQNDAATSARLVAISAGNSGWSGGNGIAQFTVGSSSATGRAVSIVNNGTGDSLRIDHAGSSGNGLIVNGGRVGFGATSPQEKLEVAGNILLNPADKFIKILANTEGTDSIVFARSDNSHQSSIGTSAYGKSILFKVGGTEIVRFGHDGKVGIGTNNPGYKLEVSGSVRATSFISDSATYADFVFKPGYKLASLKEVEAHIASAGHLAGIPSEAEAKAQGIDLAKMQVMLLQKVEELTLYAIEHQKELARLKQENTELRRRLDASERR